MDSVKSVPPNSTSASPASPTLGQQNYVQSIDLIISDYMERLGTRLNILETELKYAWRALDLLSQEYIKMWERLEKLEILLYEQQSVIAQLLEFYTVMGTAEATSEERAVVVPASESTRAVTESADDELQRTIKDLMEDAAAASVAGRDVVGDVSSDITGSSTSAAAIISELQIEMGMGEMIRMPDEAFYRSLNNAYRDDLVGSESTVPPPVTTSQLGMIWEEAEDVEETTGKEETHEGLDRVEQVEETQEVYSALDYKDYRGNSPCVNEQDLAQLTRLSVIDQVALEKLQELDRLTTKLQKDSQNLKELQDRLLESPKHKYQQDTSESTAARALTDDTSVIDEQLRQIYAESELQNWSYSTSARDLSDLILLAGTTTLPSGLSSSSKSRPSSRLSSDSGGATTDSEVASALSGFRSTVSPTTSPRHRVLLESSNSMSTAGMLSSQSSSRLNYNPASLLQADITSASCDLTSPKSLAERYDLSPYAKEFTDTEAFQSIIAAFSSVPSTTLGTFSVSSSQNLNSPPALSGSSIRTRQDGYIGGVGRLELDLSEDRNTPSPSPTSPPPPAPRDSGDAFLMPASETDAGGTIATSPSALLGASATSTTSITSPSTEQQQGRLSPRTPHSPKSPRLSPKNIVKSTSANIGTAKSDSGLSSMSGWSSLEKSPGSPKSVISSTNKTPTSSSYASDSLMGRSHQQQLATSPMAPMVPMHLSSSSSISPQESRHYNAIPTSGNFPYNAPHSPLPPFPPVLANSLIPGSHHPSAFTTVKSPTSLGGSTPSISGDSSAVNLVPSPVQSSEFSISPRGRPHRVPKSPSASAISTIGNITTTAYGDFLYLSEQPAIYSVAGSNRQQSFTSVYTSGTSSYVPKTTGSGYPDLVEPCNNNEQHPAHAYRYQAAEPDRVTSRSHSVGSYPNNSASAHSSKKNLSRGHSTGSAPPPGGVANLEGYKTAMYRTMFPTGNITDALSYYPTSTRYESTPSGNQQRVVEYNHSTNWMNSSQMHMDPNIVSQMKHDHTSASIRSMESAPASTTEYMHPQYIDPRMDPRMDPRRYPQQHYGPPPGMERGPEQDEAYPREYSWGQRPDMQYLELDLRKRNIPEQQMHDGQYYDPSGVIVSQSGYISIAADIKDSNFQPDEKVSKKGKLKSAMSSVSSWLPGLSKRHRSHSLPAGVRREDLAMSKEHGRGYVAARGKSQLHSTSTLPRKKKKNPLASTMSGILQKAKRRSHHSQSLSDPETETEWSGRQSGFSEDSEDSVFSDVPSETGMFSKVPHGMTRQSSLQQVVPNTRMASRRNSDLDQVNELPYEPEIQEQPKPLEADPASLFPTVGEVKRAAAQTVPTTTEEQAANERLQFPPVALGGASREFAVSRALGKYRQRQSSTVSVDEQTAQEEIPTTKPTDQLQPATKKENEEEVIQDEVIYDEPAAETSIDESLSSSTPQPQSRTEEAPPTIEQSPSVSSMRSYVGGGRHHQARHQQSLEIPWSGGRGEIDEDSRSTHSWRSTSRISSRRQSTEDSIDSEDEWYNYELRKLEEMERAQDEPPQEAKSETFEPDEDVKEQMSFVLQELRLKAKAREGVLDEEDYNRQVRARSEGIMLGWDEGETEIIEEAELEPTPQPAPEPEEPKKKSLMRLAGDDDSSSGETSGPDSPQQSADEMEVDEEEEAAMEAELARSVRSSSGSTLRQGERQLQGSDSLSREGSVSVPPSEVSISIKVSDGWDSEETATVREGSVSVAASDVWEGEGEAESDMREGAESSTPSIPKVKIDSTENTSSSKEDAASKDSGPMGSKWKLLKALKERKAEEKIQEAATATAAAEAKANSTTVIQDTRRAQQSYFSIFKLL